MVLEPVQIFPPFASFPTQHICKYICKVIDWCTTYSVDYKVVQYCTPWQYHGKVLDFKYRRYLASKSQLVSVFALLFRLWRLQKPPVCSWYTSMTSSCAQEWFVYSLSLSKQQKEETIKACLLHLEGFWGFVIVDAPPVKEEPEAGHRDAHLRRKSQMCPIWLDVNLIAFVKLVEPARCSFSSACPSGWSASRGSGSRWSPGLPP